MFNPKMLKRYRVRSAQIIFWSLCLYLFVIDPIRIDPLLEPRGIVGIVLATLGVLIRSLSAGFISKNQALASTGLYALTRNPLYFGSFTLLVGINLIIWHPLFAVVTFALFALTYIPTIMSEEKYLSQAFADSWPTFKQNTPRFFPAFWRLRAYSEISWSFAQWKRNHEFNAVITYVVLLALAFWYAG